MKRILSISFVMVIMIGLLTACNGSQNPTVDVNAIQTFAAQTVFARQTLSVLETKVVELTLQPTQGPVIITATPQSATRTLLPSSTPQPSATHQPSVTAQPTATRVPASATPLPTATSGLACNVAHFVKDVTVPDGTTLAPSAGFTKTWRLRNDGSCTWTTSYSLVFSSGNAMSGPAEVKLAKAIAPGESVDLSVNLITPSATGSYSGYWLLRSAAGNNFGTGSGETAFYVKVKVAIATLSDLHLTTNYCTAVWKSQAGTLTCPGSGYDFTNGSVVVATSPKLAGGSVDDEPAIVMVPNSGTNGNTAGRYPKFTVKSGDHFVTLLGCMYGYKECSVTFSLLYSEAGGSNVSLGSWDMTYDGPFVHVNIDLSSLAGKDIQFVLKVGDKTTSSKDDVAFWLNPHIVRP